jgi:hypothetical protein
MWNEGNDNTVKEINKQADEWWLLKQLYSHICQSYGIKFMRLWQSLWWWWQHSMLHFLQTQRDANSTSITNDFCASVECVQFGMCSFLSVQSVCVENNVWMLLLICNTMYSLVYKTTITKYFACWIYDLMEAMVTL